MSYTTPPCKDCENRHSKCHAKCEEYAEWSKQRKDTKEKIHKAYQAEYEADSYFYENLGKSISKCRKEGRYGRYKK